MQHMLCFVRAAVLLVALTALSTAVTKAEPLKLLVGYQGVPDKLLPMILKRRDIVPHLGTSYDFELVTFKGSTAEVTALATGDLQIATLGYSSYGIAIENAHLDDLRIFADLFRDGVEGYYSSQFVVLKDSPIRQIEDLKGKVLGSNGAGSVVDMAIRYMLKFHGMETPRDYNLIEAPLPNLIPMLVEKKVDLISAAAAYSNLPVILNQTRPLFRVRDVFGVTQFAFLAARAGFLDANRAAITDFVEDLVRATRWLINPANRDDAIQMISRYSKQPIESFTPYFLTHNDVYRDPDARPDLGALDHNLADMRKLGFLKTEIDVTKHADLSFVDAAVTRLK